MAISNNNRLLAYLLEKSNGGVKPTTITAWQLIGTTIGALALMGSALWIISSDANKANESILKELHDSYVSKQQHDDLANRVTREVARVDDLAKTDLPRPEFDRWNTAHETREDGFQKQIDAMKQDHFTKSEFGAWKEERAKTVDSMQRQIDELSTRLRLLSDRVYHSDRPVKAAPQPD